jgi:hypothetical protein
MAAMKRLAVVLLLAGCFSAPERPSGPDRGWNRVADGAIPGPQHGARLTWDAKREAVIMYTGYHGKSGNVPGYVYMWKNNEWTRICTEGTGPPPLYLPGFTWEPMYEQLVLVGGAQITAGQGLFDNVRKEIYTCDETNVWTKQVNTLQRERAGGSLIYLAQINRLVLVGGRDRSGPIRNSEVSYADAQDFDIDTIEMPFASVGAGQTATYDADSKMIFALESDTFDDTEPTLYDAIWEYDGETWARFCNECSGDPRADASIVHFGGTNETYVIGGYAGDNRDHAGTWVIDQNKLLRVYEEPEARTAFGVAHSAATDSLIMFGGSSAFCTDYECDETLELGIPPQ